MAMTHTKESQVSLSPFFFLMAAPATHGRPRLGVELELQLQVADSCCPPLLLLTASGSTFHPGCLLRSQLLLGDTSAV